MATALQIVQNAATELGLTEPTAVFGQTDIQLKQFASLLNRVGTEVMKEDHPWTMLQTEFVVQVGVPIILTGDVTNGSGIITNIADTSVLQAGAFSVSGDGIMQAARVTSIDNANQITISEYATATGTNVTLVFVRDTFNIPTDFDRYINRTMWDRTNQWELRGPGSPQMWQWMNSGVVATGPRRWWRQNGKMPTAWQIWPPPTSSDTPATLVFDYISNGWAMTSGGDYQSSCTSDSDEVLFPEHVMTLGLKAAFWRMKGFDWAPLQASYAEALNAEKARDGGSPTVPMGRRRFPIFISPAQVPDGNWPY